MIREIHCGSRIFCLRMAAISLFFVHGISLYAADTPISDKLMSKAHGMTIAQMLKEKSLIKLDLSNQNLASGDVMGLMEILKTDDTLEELYLWSNRLDDQAAREAARMLKVNKKLKVLWLSNNHITTEGSRKIAKALESNATLKDLNLSFNKISQDGVQDFYDLLDQSLNITLTKVELAANQPASAWPREETIIEIHELAAKERLPRK